MNKLLDATVRLYHKRQNEQVLRFLNAFEAGEGFENTNVTEIWWWACNRWPSEFPYRECEIRQERRSTP